MDFVSVAASSTIWSSKPSKANPNVGAAQAALRQAHELYSAQRTSFFPTIQGSFSGRSLGVPRQYSDQSHRASNPYLHSLYGPADVELRPRCLRRHPAPSRNRQGAIRQQPLSARGHLLDLEQQCGGDGGAGGLAARTNRRDRTTAAIAAPVDGDRATPTPPRHRRAIWMFSLNNRRRRKPRRLCRRCKNNWGKPAMP